MTLFIEQKDMGEFMTTPNQCAHCDAKFLGRPNRLYCSTKCRRAREKILNRLRDLYANQDWLSRSAEEARQVKNFFDMRRDLNRKEREAKEIQRIEERLGVAQLKAIGEVVAVA